MGFSFKQFMTVVASAILLFSASSSFAYNIYVVSRNEKSIYTLDSKATSTADPIRTVKLGGKSSYLYGLAYYDGELYTCDDGLHKIYIVKAKGNDPTYRTITVRNGGPESIAVNDGYIFCAIESKKNVEVFKTTDSGSTDPTRTITNFDYNPCGICVYEGELYVLCSNYKVYVFDSNADGKASDVVKRTLDLSKDIESVTSRGFFVSDHTLFLGNSRGIIYSFSISGSKVTKLTKLEGSSTAIYYSLFVKDGELFVGNFLDTTNSVEVFSSSATGDTKPLRVYNGITDVIGITMESGYVIPAQTQQSGVTVNVTQSSANATETSELESAYSIPFGFTLESPVMEFEATVSSNAVNGVFSFTTTSVNGTASSLTLLKCFSTNGTTLPFRNYSPAVDPDTEGAWWIADSDGNYLPPETLLTDGTTYQINMVVKDNGKYDEDRTLGSIKDPVVIGASSLTSGTGCVFNPSAGISLEWLLLILGVLLAAIRMKLPKA